MNYVITKFINFASDDERAGSPGAVIFDEQHVVDDAERCHIARQLAYEEVAVVDNLATSEIHLYHAQGEVDFARAILGGVAGVLASKGYGSTQLQLPKFDVRTWHEGDFWWIGVEITSDVGNWQYYQCDDVKQTISLSSDDYRHDMPTMYWAWEDKDNGTIYARTFAHAI